jgi:hypothetical protein
LTEDIASLKLLALQFMAANYDDDSTIFGDGSGQFVYAGLQQTNPNQWRY